MKMMKIVYLKEHIQRSRSSFIHSTSSAASSHLLSKVKNSAADAMSVPTTTTITISLSSIFLKPKPTKPQPPPPFLSLNLSSVQRQRKRERRRRRRNQKMCPLRLILVFLSATLAGFFILRNLNSKPDILLQTPPPTDEPVKPLDDSDSPIISRSTTVLSAIGSGFWTCVDMASGRYLWNHLSSSGKKQS